MGGEVDGASICGNCGNPYVKHYFEGDYIYCNTYTNGDVFRVQEIEELVCEDIQRRQQLGVEKYGVTVAENPLDLAAWLQHAYEECLDQAVYLKRAIVELNKERGDDAR